MTDRQALVRAVLAEPADDLPRLVLADFLDESGEGERAAYIRASVRLAELVDGGELDSDEYVGAVVAVGSTPTQSLWEWAVSDGMPLSPNPVLTRDTVGAVDSVRDFQNNVTIGFRRGFPAVVRCRTAYWLSGARRAAGAAPLERVHLDDRRPHNPRPREWIWRSNKEVLGPARNVLPTEIFVRLKGRQSYQAVYRSQRAAVDALSAACLEYARRLS
jgi:uncharacterized protein (TIGR02996 family)